MSSTDFELINPIFIQQVCFILPITIYNDNLDRSGEKPIQCDKSLKEFVHKKNVEKQHCFNTCTSEKSIKCHLCDKQFQRKSYLKKHMDNHDNEKLFVCEVCHKGFTKQTYLKNHWVVHSSEKPFKCETCSKEFPRKSDLKKHYRIHTDKKPFQCELCGRGFNQKIHLQLHKKCRTKEIRIKCEICHKKVACKNSLTEDNVNRVEQSHDEKPFPCDICHQCFKTNNMLIIHKCQQHDNNIKYRCRICHENFSLEEELDSHFLIHSDKKTFKCENTQ